jgi:hypothetical protein
MAWRTPVDAEIGALIGTRVDVVGIDVDESDAAGRCKVAV